MNFTILPILLFTVSCGAGGHMTPICALPAREVKRHRYNNQRRVRKDRRRAFAAGVKDAFKKN